MHQIQFPLGLHQAALTGFKGPTSKVRKRRREGKGTGTGRSSLLDVYRAITCVACVHVSVC